MPRLPNHLRLPATRRFQATQANVIARATPKAIAAFDDLDSYDEADIDTLTAATAGTFTAVKSIAVTSAVGYYSVLAGVRPPAIRPGDVATVPDLRSPFISIWQSFAAGNNYENALASGRARLEAVVHDYAISSARQTGDVFVEKARVHVVGWERTPDANACDWCDEVSGQLYNSADSADFGHDRCACTADPLFADD